MVAWDCLDNYIITAVSDYSLKVYTIVNEIGLINIYQISLKT